MSPGTRCSPWPPIAALRETLAWVRPLPLTLPRGEGDAGLRCVSGLPLPLREGLGEGNDEMIGFPSPPVSARGSRSLGIVDARQTGHPICPRDCHGWLPRGNE